MALVQQIPLPLARPGASWLSTVVYKVHFSLDSDQEVPRHVWAIESAESNKSLSMAMETSSGSPVPSGGLISNEVGTSMNYGRCHRPLESHSDERFHGSSQNTSTIVGNTPEPSKCDRNCPDFRPDRDMTS